jgi:uncharacterized protein (DUF433 family)
MGNEDVLKYITIDQGIRFGKPCIKGTRITVGDILQWLSEGIPMSEILDDYPLLKEIHIKTALAFAAWREEIVRVLASDKNIYETIT